jgi:hypothetical protein
MHSSGNEQGGPSISEKLRHGGRFRWWMVLVVPLAIPLFPLLVVYAIVLFSVLGLWAFFGNLAREIRFCRRMRRIGRYVSASQLAGQMAAEEGTIIVESPTLGWGVSRAWWTNEDVLAHAPMQPPDRPAPNHAFDRWCHEQYTSPGTGRAVLFKVWSGERAQRHLSKGFPGIPVVAVWSGSFVIRHCPLCGVDFPNVDSRTCPRCGSLIPNTMIDR